MKHFFQKHFLVFLWVSLGWLGFMGAVIFISKGFQFSLSNLGMFGDSFNILTSLFTGLAFAGVIISVRLQKEELKEVQKEFKEQTKALENQQKEMVIQSFDNKFFQMLNLLNNIINNFNERVLIRPRTHTLKRNSRLSFEETPAEYEEYEKREVLIQIKNGFEIRLSRNEAEFQIIFNQLNQQYDTTFKFYFINLYQILKYIDTHLGDIKSAKNYTNIVRAQLSKDELVLLFYNAIGVIPFSGENYKKLVEKYAFFEHLTYEDLNPSDKIDIVDELLKKYDATAFGKNEKLKEKVLNLQGTNS